MAEERKIPVEIIIPILEAAPLIYGLFTRFMEMVEKTKADLNEWAEKSEDEKQKIVEEASRRFDDSMTAFRVALDEVKAKG